MSSSDTDSHVCTLDRSYHDGYLWQCRCGAFWSQAAGKQLSYAFVRWELRERLREYRRGVCSGEFTSLADAVHSAMIERAQRREKERESTRLDWLSRQKAKRAKWLRAVRTIILRDPCAYCGGVGTQLDHVLPRTQGGTDVMRNLAPACGRCNREKSNRTPEQWKAWRVARGQSWPPPVSS